MTQPILAGIAGAAIGAIIAFVANVLVLPRVLLRNDATKGGVFGVPDRSKVVFAYRYIMPVVFMVVLAVASVKQFGGTA